MYRQDKTTANLLWTGGWDSTYRLIDLIYVKKVHVQPYYIISYGRASVFKELQTMQKIKGMIAKFDKKSHSRILPLIIVPRFDIHVSEDIKEKYKELNQERHVGNQYKWIAGFASQFRLTDLELCGEYVENPAGVGALINKSNNTIRVKHQQTGDYYILDKKSRKTPLSIFSNFRFPILDISKKQMYERAYKFGFDDILEQTWFCHSPIGSAPCGTCIPCQQVAEKGFKYRLSRGAIIRYHMRKYLLWANTKFGDINLYIKLKRLVRST